MILGIGVDIVEVSRIRQKIQAREDFKKIVFSQEEIDYCEKHKNPFESYSSRFAAKEAFLKSIGTGLNIDCVLKEIEVLNENSGKPFLNLSKYLSDYIKENFNVQGFRIHLSLSHTSHNAIAYLILESQEIK